MNRLLEQYADATIVGGMLVYDETDKAEKTIEITCEKINKVLGIEVPRNEVISIFKALGFQVEDTNPIKVTVPTRRLDIKIEEDLIEEVGRIYGMDKIEGKLPVLDTIKGKYDKTKRSIKHKLADLGLNETISYTLIPHDEVHKFTKDDTPAKLVPIYYMDTLAGVENVGITLNERYSFRSFKYNL